MVGVSVGRVNSTMQACDTYTGKRACVHVVLQLCLMSAGRDALHCLRALGSALRHSSVSCLLVGACGRCVDE